MPIVLVAKIKEKGSHGVGCVSYKNEVLVGDFKQLALFFNDIETFGANIEKAFIEFKKSKAEGFPW